jgi:hypothetical protein
MQNKNQYKRVSTIADKLYIDERGSLQPLRRTIKIEPMQYPESIHMKVAKFILTSLVCLGCGVMLGVIMIEWMAGCGEVTYYADRTWVSNECIFQDNEIAKGTW